MDLTFDYEDILYKDESSEKIYNKSSTNSAVSIYLKEIGKYPILTPMEEQELAKKICK